MRKNFQLPEDDIAFLNELGNPWETITENGMQWVIINDYPVIPGYNHTNVSVALKIETGYPRTQIDMAYFFPALLRLDGVAIKATCNQVIDSKHYQRWSRHRTSQNPWREGIDDLSTHLSLVDFWFEQEFIKQPNGIAA